MLKLKLQYFGHMMWRAYSLEKTLMLGKTEGERRGGPVDMRLSKLRSSEGQGSLPSCSSRGRSQAWLSHWTAATHRRVYFTQPSAQSVQFSRSFMSDSLRPHEPQHARPPCPSPAPGVHSNSCPSSRWCHPAISSSVVPFSSCPQSLAASGSFPVSQLFAWGSQSIGVSASASVLLMNTQDWSPLGWAGWISLRSKGLSGVFSNTIVQKHHFFRAQLSSQSNSHIHIWPLEKP